MSNLFGFPQGLSGGSKETSYATTYGTDVNTAWNTTNATSYNTNVNTAWNTSHSTNTTTTYGTSHLTSGGTSRSTSGTVYGSWTDQVGSTNWYNTHWATGYSHHGDIYYVAASCNSSGQEYPNSAFAQGLGYFKNVGITYRTGTTWTTVYDVHNAVRSIAWMRSNILPFHAQGFECKLHPTNETHSNYLWLNYHHYRYFGVVFRTVGSSTWNTSFSTAKITNYNTSHTTSKTTSYQTTHPTSIATIWNTTYGTARSTTYNTNHTTSHITYG